MAFVFPPDKRPKSYYSEQAVELRTIASQLLQISEFAASWSSLHEQAKQGRLIAKKLNECAEKHKKLAEVPDEQWATEETRKKQRQLMMETLQTTKLWRDIIKGSLRGQFDLTMRDVTLPEYPQLN